MWQLRAKVQLADAISVDYSSWLKKNNLLYEHGTSISVQNTLLLYKMEKIYKKK